MRDLNSALAALRCARTMQRVQCAWPRSPIAARLFSSSTSSPPPPPPKAPKTPEQIKNDKDRNIAINVITVIVFVFGVSYLMVPLYRIFCSMTGVAGDVQVKNQTLLDEVRQRV